MTFSIIINDTKHKDAQHNDIQHNDIKHNDIQHNYGLKLTLWQSIVKLIVLNAEYHR
jgi:hypothetical protein